MATKEKESKALPEGQAENPKKTSKVKRIVIILAILLITLSGAGIGAYWWFFMRTPSSAASAPAVPAATDAAGKGVAVQMAVLPLMAVLAQPVEPLGLPAQAMGALSGRVICPAAAVRFCLCLP